jgi:hypothetical protein
VNNKEFRDRLTWSWFRYQLLKQEQRSQLWLSGEVSRRLGREPLSQGTVSRWFRGAVPDLESMGAVAATLEVDPGWLAFGSQSRAPAPDNPMIGGSEFSQPG